jgi:hypothetical protein
MDTVRMAQGSFVSYLRVSTARQGLSGLGLEAQRKAVADYLNGGQWSLIAEYVEVESGGKPRLRVRRFCPFVARRNQNRLHGCNILCVCRSDW